MVIEFLTQFYYYYYYYYIYILFIIIIFVFFAIRNDHDKVNKQMYSLYCYPDIFQCCLLGNKNRCHVFPLTISIPRHPM